MVSMALVFITLFLFHHPFVFTDEDDKDEEGTDESEVGDCRGWSKGCNSLSSLEDHKGAASSEVLKVTQLYGASKVMVEIFPFPVSVGAMVSLGHPDLVGCGFGEHIESCKARRLMDFGSVVSNSDVPSFPHSAITMFVALRCDISSERDTWMCKKDELGQPRDGIGSLKVSMVLSRDTEEDEDKVRKRKSELGRLLEGEGRYWSFSFTGKGKTMKNRIKKEEDVWNSNENSKFEDHSTITGSCRLWDPGGGFAKSLVLVLLLMLVWREKEAEDGDFVEVLVVASTEVVM